MSIKVLVHARYTVCKTFEIEVNEESEIRDKAWDYSYDYAQEFGVYEASDVDWEVLDE